MPVVFVINLGIPLAPVHALLPYPAYSRIVVNIVAVLDKYELLRVISVQAPAAVDKDAVVMVPATLFKVTEFPVTLPFEEIVGEYAAEISRPFVTVNEESVPEPTIKFRLSVVTTVPSTFGMVIVRSCVGSTI